MKIALIFPRTSKELHGVWPPLGIIQLGTVMKNRGHELKLIDSSFDDDLERAKIKLKDFEPDIVGISTMSSLFENAIDISAYSKKMGYITIMGGPHPTMFPKETLTKAKGLDFIIIGEGEETLPELVSTLEKKGDIKKVKGICYMKGGQAVFNKPRPPMNNLDSIPIPDRGMLDNINQYLESGALNLNSIRGCPFNCKFCQPTLRKLFGEKIRKMSPKRVVDELDYLYKKYQLRDYFFVDDTFTIDKEWMREIVSELDKRQLKGKLRFILNTRANLFDEELARLIVDFNCYYVAIGVESGSQKILDDLDKGITISQIKKTFRLCKKYRIKTHAYFMLGSPGETKETLKETEILIDEIKPTSLFLAVTTPLPGTKLFDELKKAGRLNIQSYSHFDYHGYYMNELPIKIKDLSYQEIVRFNKRILRKRRMKLLFSNGIDLIKDVIHEKSLSKVKFRWKLYRRMVGYFG
jgi:radical SAM superfamily enzyme YgiQ (UPF0313 family)